ncbi:hypothetical protein CSV67_14055 [Sporosarcina sp. P2]|uniref:hypothetical protein n=1 Tax=Sporosarcina sp. P2 TaxID=2048251 RepID=UPI000C16539B|nr:hypothetical protein [Sporosarcina sp. P2]PID01468.1 hypothetical protein CSV67_14055 [Sporosarcina sp. P2]
MKQFWKATFALILLVCVLGAGLKADAAVKPGTPEPVEKKPYEYEFVEDSAEKYNGFTGAKKMVITFDKDINSIKPSDVYVEQIVEGRNKTLPLVKNIDPVGKKLTITFKNLELVDYKGKEDFQLVVKQGKLYFDQLTNYEFPFKFYDLTPGFESVFVNTNNATLINEKIFKHNEPRNIMIQVPPIYITKIETIHRYKGVVDPAKSAPNLSNIDVIAHEEAKRLKVKLGTNNTQYERDLDRSTAGVNGFSMGQAGIDDLACVPNTPPKDGCKEYTLNDDFELTAFSKDGRKLETKNFKIRVSDKEKDFKINDYVKADTKFIGKPVSLYELMLSPILLDNIMKEIDVRALNDLGVSYSVAPVATVTTREQLELALINDKLKKISLSGNFNLANTPAVPFVIDRDVTIAGGTITGDIQLGNGKDRIIRLEGTKINGNLIVDVGANGTAVLDKVTVTGNTSDPHTKIVSGGSKSIHLNDFKSRNGIEVSNIKQLRIVTTNTFEDTLIFDYKAQAPVQLEVVSGKVDLTLGEDNMLAESNKFTVFANDKNDVTVSSELTNNTYFSLNEEVVELDETPGIKKIDTKGRFIEVLNENGEFSLENFEISELYSETILKDKTLEEWTVVDQTEGWKIIKITDGFNVSQVSGDGFITLETSDGDTVYHLPIQIKITS